MLSRSDIRRMERIARALEATWAQTLAVEQEGVRGMDIDANTARIIILSDQHRGARNGADDFRETERAYNAALAYYFRMGHQLVVLGDGEELWEERPRVVVDAYRHTLELEAQFHQADRYLRFWGNHDDLWSYSFEVKRHLEPIYGPRLRVHESLRFPILDAGRRLGYLFLAHGHQGSSVSDGWMAPLSRFFVRHIWRRLQRLTKVSANTPANDWELREVHKNGMYAWANLFNKRQERPEDRLVLIVGHTHRPVFGSQSHPAHVMERLEARENALAERPHDPDLLKDVSLLSAKLEWVRAQEHQKPDPDVEAKMVKPKPCFFNTGCCSFLDGDITGIELFDGEIRLVRWPDQQDNPRPQILARTSLRDVFASL